MPEFSVDYQIIRTRAGKFRTRGTVRQNFENLHMPVELTLHSEGDSQTKVLYLDGKSEDFDFESNGQPIAAEVDPNDKILRMSDDLKVSIVARRGIELFHDGQYAEAQQQLETALKLDRNNAWVYYNLGLIYFEQKNWQLALDNFQAALDAVSSKPGWIDTWAHIKRGNAYDAKGDRNKAVFEYNKALQAGSNYDNAQATAKKFINTPYDPKAVADFQSYLAGHGITVRPSTIPRSNHVMHVSGAVGAFGFPPGLPMFSGCKGTSPPLMSGMHSRRRTSLRVIQPAMPSHAAGTWM